MYYKRNNKRLSVSGRGDYMSTSDFIIQYYTNLDACRKFFYDIKWPTGYYCEKCGCTHYYFMKTKNCYRCANCKHDERLLSNTIFQDNKLPLNVLLYGLFLIFTANNGISSMELSKELKVNYKTACLLQTKARILMKNSNSKRFLDSDFYESDVAYTGAPSHNGKRGLGTGVTKIIWGFSVNNWGLIWGLKVSLKFEKIKRDVELWLYRLQEIHLFFVVFSLF